MADPALTLVIDDHVAIVELCRPEVHNRFDHVLQDEFDAMLQSVRTDADVRALLLRAQGRVFSGGGDTARMLEGSTQSVHDRFAAVDEGRALFRRCADFPKPFVVALSGDVYGLGTSIVLTADALVSAPGVRLADPHVRMGLVAGDGGIVGWPMNVAMALAKRHLLWGDPLLVEDAHRLGVVTDLVATRDEVDAHALALARRVAEMPPVAVQLTKRALNQVVGSRANEAFDLGFYLEAVSLGTDDMVEAVTAFLDKRAGVWKGR